MKQGDSQFVNHTIAHVHKLLINVHTKTGGTCSQQ